MTPGRGGPHRCAGWAALHAGGYMGLRARPPVVQVGELGLAFEATLAMGLRPEHRT
jgi:hypothetical protein